MLIEGLYYAHQGYGDLEYYLNVYNMYVYNNATIVAIALQAIVTR